MIHRAPSSSTAVKPFQRRSRLSFLLPLCLSLLAFTAIPAAWGNSAAQQSAKQCKGTATFAGLVGEPPTYFFPMYQVAYWDTGYVPWASYLMWRPLYIWGKGNKPVFNEKRSLAKPPVFSTTPKGNTVATITLKHWQWSNGHPVTTRDVQFWMNLLQADKTQWAPYVPKEFPDNVASIKYLSKRRFRITFKGHYSHVWLLANELDQITPIPQFAWDRTSLGGPVKNYDLTPKGAKAVYKFLQKQAKTPASFGSSPLWKVVDGPWQLASFHATNGLAKFKPNKYYPWPVSHHLCRFIEKPFTSATAEINALETGRLDVGYVPMTSLHAIPALKRKGYRIAHWYQDAFAGLILSYAKTNATTPILDKLYVRQALTHLIPMKAIIKDIYHGLAYYSSSPIPDLNGHGSYVTAADKTDPYPYNPKVAARILSNHGWHVAPNGKTVCAKPGTGTGHCGKGIRKGAAMTFATVGTSSSPTELHLLEVIQSGFRQAGVTLKLKTVPESELPSDAGNCVNKAHCSWDMELWMGEWPLGWTPYLESGGNTFACHAGSNFSNLCNKTNDGLIAAIHSGKHPIKALKKWENYMSHQQFQIFLPIPVYRIVAYKKNLQGVTPLDPYLQIFPEDWHYGGKA